MELNIMCQCGRWSVVNHMILPMTIFYAIVVEYRPHNDV